VAEFELTKLIDLYRVYALLNIIRDETNALIARYGVATITYETEDWRQSD
jgi:hypothetical protein